MIRYVIVTILLRRPKCPTQSVSSRARCLAQKQGVSEQQLDKCVEEDDDGQMIEPLINTSVQGLRYQRTALHKQDTR